MEHITTALVRMVLNVKVTGLSEDPSSTPTLELAKTPIGLRLPTTNALYTTQNGTK